MNYITARKVTSGMTIKTSPGEAGHPEPVTMRVADGYYYGDDETAPTHVSLADADGNELILHLGARVMVLA